MRSRRRRRRKKREDRGVNQAHVRLGTLGWENGKGEYKNEKERENGKDETIVSKWADVNAVRAL